MLKKLISDIVQHNVTTDAWIWLTGKAELVAKEEKAKELNASFAVLPRKTGKNIISLTEDQKQQLARLRNGFSVENWPTDRLSRVWLLLQPDPAVRDAYLQKIENLFSGAEMNELISLYSSLPLLTYGDAWKWRCAEGIRSNIAGVHEAIMYENPYPFEQLDEPSWNQMILKAFFTDKQVERIVGLDKRANHQLASILIDYAHERLAAHRSVNIQLWRLVGRFIDEDSFGDILKLFHTGNEREKKAAALACAQSEYHACQTLLNKSDKLKRDITSNKLTWESLIRESAVV
jgi:hypothetical protein